MTHRTLTRLATALGLSLLLNAATQAAEPPAELMAALEKYAAGESIESITESPLPGLYEVLIGARLFYLSGDGRYMVKGSIIDIPNGTNVTDEREAQVRKTAISRIDPEKMIIYAPEETKYTISVFTDIDCGYCRKLHREMDDYLNRGIAVQYLLYPRGGTRAASYDKSVAVWCSDDRQKALTQAKMGEDVGNNRCDNPVGEHMVLGKEFGLNGTPTIVLPNGSVIPGYVPADSLVKVLAELETDR